MMAMGKWQWTQISFEFQYFSCLLMNDYGGRIKHLYSLTIVMIEHMSLRSTEANAEKGNMIWGHRLYNRYQSDQDGWEGQNKGDKASIAFRVE
jgi:hypothetical protein